MNNRLVFALPKGRLGTEAIARLHAIGLAKNITSKSRKLVFNDDKNIRYILVKPVDVITYVENGIADIGIIGSDIILEQNANVYEMMDLGFGQCKFSIAGLKDQTLYKPNEVIKVATKYPNVTKKYFQMKAQKIEIIKINGSVELAPLLGLSNVIVDIVETGNTLKANGLVIIEHMMDISAKTIVNRSSYRFKTNQIIDVHQRLKTSLEDR